MVKKHHPDTSNDGGWKFNQIDHAYKQLMQKFREDKIRFVDGTFIKSSHLPRRQKETKPKNKSNNDTVFCILLWREEQSVGEYGLYYDQTKMTQEEDGEDDEHPDIRHTAPQHRQYLGRFN